MNQIVLQIRAAGVNSDCEAILNHHSPCVGRQTDFCSIINIMLNTYFGDLRPYVAGSSRSGGRPYCKTGSARILQKVFYRREIPLRLLAKNAMSGIRNDDQAVMRKKVQIFFGGSPWLVIAFTLP